MQLPALGGDRRPDHVPVAGSRGTYDEGDAYFEPPGHLPLITAGTSVVEFSPTADLHAVQTVIGANMDGGAA
jgi:hypothetical protein